IEIAKKVINQEISTNKNVIINLVKEAIKKLEDKEKIIIYTNPADLDIVKSHRDEFKQLVDTIDTLHILPDELLEPGECRLESNIEIIDTDINYQLEEIKKKLHSKE
ncbi:MAG TPA: FliH/SctL family protein, partial [Candidatus Goldiibacteriota bacterium]|nr:FliH/SctL family protein [Candidatus Goldiibacteriota bacterium]